MTSNPTTQPAADEPERVWIVSVVMVQNGPNKVNTQNKLYEITASETAEARGKARELAASDFPQHYVHTVCQIEVTRAQSAAFDALVAALQLIASFDGLTNLDPESVNDVDYGRGAAYAYAECARHARAVLAQVNSARGER